MLYLLARSALTQHDLEKSKITLASYDHPFLSKLSSCYCVLHFPIVPCNQGAPRKRGGSTVANIFLQFTPEFVPLHTSELLLAPPDRPMDNKIFSLACNRLNGPVVERSLHMRQIAISILISSINFWLIFGGN